jgi:hypothetical protein
MRPGVCGVLLALAAGSGSATEPPRGLAVVVEQSLTRTLGSALRSAQTMAPLDLGLRLDAASVQMGLQWRPVTFVISPSYTPGTPSATFDAQCGLRVEPGSGGSGLVVPMLTASYRHWGLVDRTDVGPSGPFIGGAFRLDSLLVGAAVEYQYYVARPLSVSLGLAIPFMEWRGIDKQSRLDFSVDAGNLSATLRVTLALNRLIVPGETRSGARPVPAPRTPEPAPAVAPAVEAPPGVRLNLAVATIEPQGVSASNASVVADWLRGELVQSRRFNVVERQNVEKVLAEQALQQSGCTSQECAVKLGRLLNAQRIVVGGFAKFLESYVLNVRVVDVETGTIVYSDTAKGKSEDDIQAEIRALAARIVANVR